MSMTHHFKQPGVRRVLERYWWIPTLLLFILFFHQNNNYRNIKCLFIDNVKSSWRHHARLFPCSNVRQKIEYESSSNITSVEADAPGWRIVKANDTSSPAVLVVTAVKDRDQMVFFPRVNGIADSIGVYEVFGSGNWHRIALAESDSKEWSEIGRQCRIDLCCIEHGDIEKEFDFKLYFVLTGPWSQIWVKDDAVLF